MLNTIVLSETELHDIDMSYYTIPVIIGFLLSLIIIGCSIRIKRYRFLLLATAIIIDIFSLAIGFILTIENPKVIGREITVQVKDKKTIKQLKETYPEIIEVDQNTYVIRIYSN